MKSAAFAYQRPASLAEACAALAQHGGGARLLAGGQSLLPALNLRLAAPDLLIDISGLPELRQIRRNGGVLHIGAGLRHAELLADRQVAELVPLLPLALAHVAHPAIRNRGTIGGSLANADPAAELPACALALGASLLVASKRGQRVLPAQGFFTGLFTTALAEDEIITEIHLPLPPPGSRAGFLELARRSGDYAIAGLAAQAVASGGRLAQLRLGFFSVGPMPLLANAAAAILCAGPVTPARIAEAQQALAQDLPEYDDPQASAATRLRLSRLLLRRVLHQILPDQILPELQESA